MERPTRLTHILEMPDFCSLFRMSLCGARQVRMLWGSMSDTDLKSLRFSVSKFNQRLYFKRDIDGIIYLLPVVDGIAFASNKRQLLDEFHRSLEELFDVKLYGKITSFIGWTIITELQGITNCQNRNNSRLFQLHGYVECNTVSTHTAFEFIS